MITFLPGGTGTARLVSAFRTLLHDEEIAVVTTVADADWRGGGHIAPALDTMLFLFAGILNAASWTGIRGDTYSTHRFLEKIGRQEMVEIGDKERAVQIARGDMLRDGLSLTAATEVLCGSFGIGATILPATNAEMQVIVETDTGPLSLLEYALPEYRGNTVTGIRFSSSERPIAGKKVIECMQQSDAIIIGPDHPILSVGPVLACEGLRELLNEAFVIAISPFGTDAHGCQGSGPLIRAGGMEPNSAALAESYGEFVDLFVQHVRDPVEVEGALRLGTSMRTRSSGESLAWDLMAVIRSRMRREQIG